MTPKRMVIVGGGITGLAAAYRLKKQAAEKALPLEVILLEASSRVGGSLKTVHQDGFLLEGGPDCFISDKPRGIALCRELGIEQELIGTQSAYRRSFIVRGHSLIPIPEGFYLLGPAKLRPFLASPLLSWKGKFRVLMEPLIPKGWGQVLQRASAGKAGAKPSPSYRMHAARPDPSSLQDESLGSFVRRRMGQEALDRLAQPLVAGIYAADPETLSLRATFPQFLEMEEKYGSVLLGLKLRSRQSKTARPGGSGIQQASGARYSLFVSFRRGIQTLVDALEKALGPQTIRLRTRVESVFPMDSYERPSSSESGVWKIRLSDGSTLTADGVCLALPAYASGVLVRTWAPELARHLTAIPYEGSATLNWAFRQEALAHPMNGIGFVTPHSERRPLLAATFAHRKFAGRAPDGFALIRCFVGGGLQKELMAMDDKSMEARLLQDLTDLIGVSAPPLFSVIHRWPGVIPQYTLGHLNRVLAIEEHTFAYKGLTLAGNWQNGVGIPDCIESGEQAAEKLLP